jgi:hypothetical protein
MNENNNSLSRINDRLFITNEMDKQNPSYRWTPPENLETRFGVELESCIKINKDCINFDATQFNMLEPVLFRQKFNYYYKNIISKSKSFNNIAKQYKFLIADDDELYYYDMEHPEELGKTVSELEEYLLHKKPNNGQNYKAEVEEEIKELIQKHNDYELPIFVDDLSIHCGETRNKNEREEAFIDSRDSFRFECITPILSIKGYPTKENIAKVLTPFLTLYGLDKPDCFILNHSMGFHVNVSLYDTKNREYVPIAEPPFFNQLLKNYIPVERMIYNTVRTRKPKGANETFISKYAKPLYGNLNKYKEDSNESFRNGKTGRELSKNDIINKIMTENTYASHKYKAIKKKSPFLLEFRLFEGDSDMKRLINNVFTTMDVLHKTANDKKELIRVDKPINKAFNNNSNNNSSNSNNNYYNSNNSNNSINVNYLGGKRKVYKIHKTIKRRTMKRKTTHKRK